MIDDHEIHMALRARLEDVPSLPPALDRSWTSVNFVPSVARKHVETDFVPATKPVVTIPTRDGLVRATGLYVVRTCGLANVGEDAVRSDAKDVEAAFLPGTGITLESGNQLTILGDPAPFTGQALPNGKGKLVCSTKIPYECYGFNTAP
jgi:hypothetical protein